MFDAFAWDEWSETITQFWTFSGQDGTSAGTVILTILGFAVMLISFFGFVILEEGKLARQAEKLRSTGALDRPPAA
ncbi:MAG: hypothetical protein OEW31_08845 [Thermoleophilia bacterium]|nr:hypothetical protein [Thermoleophilia bacterium]MDH4346428.1 hypothetical protein [Thermoleophilia bacterium]